MRVDRVRTTTTVVVALLACAVTPTAALAGGWLPTTTLRTSTTDRALGLDTATAPDGTTFVAFDAVEGGIRRAVVASRRPGEELGAYKAISSPASDIAGVVDVAVDRQGNAVLVWVRNGQVEVASRPAGQDWGTPTPLTATGVSAVNTAAVAMGDNGAAVVTWASANTGAGQRVSVAFRPAGAGAFVDGGVISDPGATTDTILGVPSVAIDADGDYAVAWRRTFDFDGAGATYTSRAYSEMRVKPVGAPFGAVRHLSPYPTTVSTTFTTPSLSMTPAGRILAAWDRYDGTKTFVETTEYVPGGAGFAAGAYTVAVQPYSRAGSSFQRPLASLDPAGGATILFYDFAVQVVSRSSTVGGFSPARTLSGAGAEAFYSTIGQAANGDTFVAWPASDGGVRRYVAARRPAGTETFETPVEVASFPLPTNQYASFEDLGVDGDDEGNAFLAFSREAYSFDTFTRVGSGTHAVGFDAGSPSLTLTAPATGTAGVSAAFSAATTDRMSPVSVAWDFGDGSTATGVSPSHTYAAVGTFTVKATATDGVGNKTEASRVVQISAPVPVPTPTPAAPGGGPGPVVATPSLPATPTFRTLGKPTFGKGAQVAVTCGEACTFTVSVRVSKTVAKKRGLGKKSVAIGTAKGTLLKAGSKTVTVKLTANARKKLAKVKTLATTLVLSTTGPSGKAADQTKPLTLKR